MLLKATFHPFVLVELSIKIFSQSLFVVTGPIIAVVMRLAAIGADLLSKVSKRQSVQEDLETTKYYGHLRYK